MGVAYLEKYAQAVLDNGYAIVAIRPGEKRPFGKQWEEKTFGPKTLAAFLERGRGEFGVGIKSAKTPGVDIDCYDADLVEHMIEFVTDRCGETLQRTGLPPKTLLPYRAREAFPKTQSKVFLDDEGRAVKLEVLADGQQFVALHVHPDTGKPYRWKDKRHPGNTPRKELPIIDQEDALAMVEEFEKQCRERGWPEKKSGQAMSKRSGDYDYDDPFITDKAKVELPAEEIRKKLDLVSDPDEHDHWFMVGMALFHQFDGSDEGLEMWHEWSAQAHNYDRDALDARWKTFDVEGKKREPITARYILKHAKQEEERLAGEALDEITAEIQEAPTYPAMRELFAKIKKEAFDPFQRDMLAGVIQKRYEKLTGTKIGITAVRASIKYENPENTATPNWLEPFVYMTSSDEFFDMETGRRYKTKTFDAAMARYMMTKKERLEGKSAPEHSASHAALNRYEIPTVDDARYMPDVEPIFALNGITYVNRFNPESLPEMPERLSRKQKALIDRLLKHMEHLFAHERDRKLLLSWMAYIVQTHKRSNWSPLIQGAEADGKTTIAAALAVALGGKSNATTINGDSLAEKYTPWAEGKLFVIMEEVRLHGENRFDVLNRMKPYISNETVPIRRMQTDLYEVLNTVNYLMLSNFKNALPINDEDTRYFPIFSRWQSKKRLDAFKREHPDYYRDLHECLSDPGALRRFFMDYELHPEFDPMKRAPDGAARREMVALNRTSEEDALDDAIESSSDPLVSEAILDPQHAMEAVDGLSLPYGRALNSFLVDRGWKLLGRFKIEGKKRSIWSQEPERFEAGHPDERIIAKRIRDFIAEGGDAI